VLREDEWQITCKQASQGKNFVSSQQAGLGTGGRGPSGARLWIRVLLAIAAVGLLLAVLFWERKQSRSRWSSLVAGSPRTGAQLFEKKGCASCHIPGAGQARQAPDLAADASGRSRPDQLVTVMWNHAPQMWERMQAQKLVQPTFSEQEMADLLAYVYTLRYVGEPGNPAKGESLFAAKGCVACHRVQSRGGLASGDIPALDATMTAVGWATAMWNHPEASDAGRPRFEGREMNDILSYVRGGGTAPRLDEDLLRADFSRGWQVFRDKSCAACHSVKDEAGRIGPELGPGRELPATILELAGSMWNHSPAMLRQMEHLHIQRAVFRKQEMADLLAFLYSFRYAEPGGSPKVGEVLFAGRGCSHCHGVRGQGTAQAPALRGRGKNYTAVTMATALWRHGPAMYRRAQDLGMSWPLLVESDVGDLITFLNTAPENER
jgi:mono/diheme cytochrome c family protein